MIYYMNIIYLDVRTPEEFLTGHYDNAINFPVQEILKGNMPLFSKDIQIKVYCRSGNRSEIAKKILQENGFSHVENIGGYKE